MADTVGAMYVKVISDTKGLKKQIEKAGEESGQRYGRKWQKAVANEINKGSFADAVERTFKDSARRQARAIATMQAKGLKAPKIEFQLDPDSIARLRDVARHLGLDFEEAMDQNIIDAKRMAKMVADERVKIDREAERQKDEDRRRKYKKYLDWQKRTTAKYAEMADTDAVLRKQRLRYLMWDAKTTQKYAKMGAQARVKEEREALALQKRMLDNFFTVQRTNYKALAGVRQSLNKKIGVNIDTTGVDRFYARVKKIDLEMRNFSRRSGIWGTMLVSPFRALTATLRPVAGLVRAPLKALEAMGRGMDVFGQKMMKNLGTGRMKSIFGPLSAGISMAGSSLSGLMKAAAKSPWTAVAAAVVAATVGLKMFNSVMGAMVALVSAAVGVVTMLASALYAAAANAVLLVPMVGALGVGLAGLVVGGLDSAKSIGLLAKAMNETDPKKRAKLMKEYNREIEKLGPNARSAMTELAKLTKGFTTLKREAGEALFKGMEKSLKAAQPLIKAVEDGLVLVSGAVGDVIDKFLRLGEDSTFVKDLGTMFKGTATIIRDLGGAAVDVFAGLNAVFAAIMPLVTDFTGSIGDAAENFRKWAQSEEGRDKILTWFTTAKEVGGKVWDIIKEIGLALHDLFTAGMESDTTTGVLDTLLTKVQEFRDTIKQAKEDGTLEKWFTEAKETAKNLWEAIETIGGALKALNTEENREFLYNLIGAISGAIDAFTKLSTIASFALKPIVWLISPIVNAIKGMVSIIYEVIKKIEEMVQRFKDAKSEGKSTFDSIKAAVKPFTDALKGVWDWLGKIIGRISQIRFPSIPSAFTSLAGKLFAAGGITNGPSIVGEAGPEMVIPLTRPLSQVDPSVRAIAAMLRGQSTDRVVTGGATGPTKIVNNDIKVYAPSADPEAVAAQVVNRSVAMAM
jgi:hypothetical protein